MDIAITYPSETATSADHQSCVSPDECVKSYQFMTLPYQFMLGDEKEI